MTDHPNSDFQPNNGPDNNEKNPRPKSAASGLKTFSSLRLPNFRLLFVSTLLINAAHWTQQVTVSWLVYHLTGSGAMLGSISLVRAVATIGIIPFAGDVIDRYDRKKLLVLVSAYLFVLAFILGLALVLGYAFIWALFTYAFLAGVAQILNGNLYQVIVFDIVPRTETPNAVALIQTGWGLMRSFGPAIGGFLILWFGAGGNFLIQATAYVLIAFTVSKIRFPKAEARTNRDPFLKSIKGGIDYVAHKPVTRAFMLMGFVLPVFIVPTFNVLSPIYAKEIFGGGPDTLGLLMSSIGVGGILGGLITASLSRVERRGIVQLGALFLLSLSLIAFALSNTLVTGMFFLGLSGFFEVIFLTSNQTLLQLTIPDHLRGRVTSVVNLNFALGTVGGIFSGVGADLFGSPRYVTLIMAGTACIISILVFLFSPSIRDFRMSKALATTENDE